MEDTSMFTTTPIVPTTVTVEFCQEDDVLNTITVTSTDNDFLKEFLANIMENRKTSIKEGLFTKE